LSLLESATPEPANSLAGPEDSRRPKGVEGPLDSRGSSDPSGRSSACMALFIGLLRSALRWVLRFAAPRTTTIPIGCGWTHLVDRSLGLGSAGRRRVRQSRFIKTEIICAMKQVELGVSSRKWPASKAAATRRCPVESHQLGSRVARILTLTASKPAMPPSRPVISTMLQLAIASNTPPSPRSPSSC